MAERSKQTSMTYTLSAVAENIKKLVDMELLTKEEAEDMKALHEQAVKAYMRKQFKVG